MALDYQIILSILALVLVLATMAWGVAHGRIGQGFKIIALALFVLGTIPLGSGIYYAIGTPMPTHLRLVPEGENLVLGYKVVANEAIFVMLDAERPTFYKLLWDKDLAALMEEEKAKGEGAGDIYLRRKKGDKSATERKDGETSLDDHEVEALVIPPAGSGPAKPSVDDSDAVILPNSPQ